MIEKQNGQPGASNSGSALPSVGIEQLKTQIIAALLAQLPNEEVYISGEELLACNGVSLMNMMARHKGEMKLHVWLERPDIPPRPDKGR